MTPRPRLRSPARAPRWLAAGLTVAALALAATIPVAADPPGDYVPPYCRHLSGKAYGLCNAYCMAMGCHRPDHDASQTACDKKFEQFYDETGTVPPCEICGGPTGPIPCGNLAAEPVLDSDGPLELAVIDDQPRDNSLLWAVHNMAKGRGLGRVTRLSVADVVAGGLRDRHFDLVFLGRLWASDLPPTESHDLTRVPLELEDELDLALAAGSGLVTEWQGASGMFSGVGRLPAFQVFPPWGWFAGSLDRGTRSVLLRNAVFHNVAPEHPVMQGIPETFSNPDIDGCYLMWEVEDPSLEVLATVEMAGHTLPAVIAAQRHRGQVVMWLCDWADDAALPPFASDDESDLVVESFLANSIEHASVPACEPGTYGPECRWPVSCADLLALDPEAASGLHTIDPDGDGPRGEGEVFCDMDTDGGGWTRLLAWDREADAAAHTLASLEAAMVDEIAAAGDPEVTPMGELGELADRILWSDTDFSYDALSYRLDVEVANGGELLLDLHYRGESMEDSAVWFYATAGGAAENVLCYSTADAGDGYSAAELALVPYACADTTGATFTFDGPEQRAFAGEITAFTLRSLHANIHLLDVSYLFRLVVAVR